tara:strand:+ start:35913 stop:36653 length:741 start_codon:yes stop_codon:yes gene_type:complete
MKKKININNLGSGISSVEGTWKFNKNVANVFDKHVKQSIPHYDDIQDYIVSLSEWYIKDNSVIHDLGCSTGETIKKINHLNLSNNYKIIGYDTSKRMIDLAKKKVRLSKKKRKINFVCKSVLDIKRFEKSNLFISILLFPFLKLSERKKILKKIYDSLETGGAFICVEKIRANNANYEDIFNQIYFDFKLKKKLNEKQILNKAKSLRSSMNLFSQNQTIQLIKDSKFQSCEIFFKCFNFIGYIAIK